MEGKKLCDRCGERKIRSNQGYILFCMQCVREWRINQGDIRAISNGWDNVVGGS
jgi:hypothetical protein